MNLLFAQCSHENRGWQAPWWDRLDPIEQCIWGFAGFVSMVVIIIWTFHIVGVPIIDSWFAIKDEIAKRNETESEFKERIKGTQFIETDGEL